MIQNMVTSNRVIHKTPIMTKSQMHNDSQVSHTTVCMKPHGMGFRQAQKTFSEAEIVKKCMNEVEIALFEGTEKR